MASSSLRWTEKILWVITWATSVVMLLTYAVPYVPATVLGWMAPLGLVYLPILAFMGLLLVIWLFKVKKHALLPLAVILLGTPLHLRLYGFGTSTPSTGENTLKVLSFNVRVFNRYDWIQGMDVPQAMVDLVSGERPEVMCVQEFFKPKAPDFGFKTRFFTPTVAAKNYGLAIYTQLPVVDQGERLLTRHPGLLVNKFQWMDVVAGGDTLRIINAHLASIRLGGADYELLRNPEDHDEETVTSGLRNLVRRFVYASAYRAQQTEELMSFASQSPHPVVICTDMNDTPTSFAYQRIHGTFPDTFAQAGKGWGATLVSSPFPLRIDHIFASPHLAVSSHRVLPQVLSDHRGVMVSLELPSTPAANPID
jgi:endonuclease/exonuclease/phosphatase family metal-dependent hydrolase